MSKCSNAKEFKRNKFFLIGQIKGKERVGGNNINIVVSPKQAKLTSDSFLKRFITGQGHIVFVMVPKTKS